MLRLQSVFLTTRRSARSTKEGRRDRIEWSFQLNGDLNGEPHEAARDRPTVPSSPDAALRDLDWTSTSLSLGQQTRVRADGGR